MIRADFAAVGAREGLSLSGLAIGVTPVTLCLASGLVFDNPRNTVLLGRLAGIALGSGRSLDQGLPLRGLGQKAFLFLSFCAVALGTALFPRDCDSLALGLSRQEGRLGGFLGGEIGAQERGLGVSGSAAAVHEFTIGDIFQTSVPIEVFQAGGQSGPRSGFCRFSCRRSQTILRFFRQTGFPQANGLFVTSDNKEVELFEHPPASNRLGLDLSKGNLRRLTRLVVCLCHGCSDLNPGQ